MAGQLGRIPIVRAAHAEAKYPREASSRGFDMKDKYFPATAARIAK